MIRFSAFLVVAAVGTLIASVFQLVLRKHEHHWQDDLIHRVSVKGLAILTFLIWVAIIVLGRLIAYDHVWGSWSPATKA